MRHTPISSVPRRPPHVMRWVAARVLSLVLCLSLAPAGRAQAPADPVAALNDVDIAAARPSLRRLARSAELPEHRAAALSALAQKDAGAATARICARALRIDEDATVRRAAAECLGRADAGIGVVHAPALVAALDDPNLDVVTMAGWALQNVGDTASILAVAARARHDDPRVARLFIAYTDKMKERLGLDYTSETNTVALDASGRQLIPPAVVMTTQAHGLDVALATGWLGLTGGMLGWFHGAFLLSVHGGTAGASAAPLGGLAGAAVGAALASTYGFMRADTIVAAHTVVQLATLGTLAGYGAGIMSAVPPVSAVNAANFALLGTVTGAGIGIVMREAGPPTLGALGAGIFATLTTGLAVGPLVRSYVPSDSVAMGAGLFAGSVAGTAATLGLSQLQLGLFPLATGTLGTLVGAGSAALLFGLVQPGATTPEQVGWGIAAGTLGGAAAGAALGMLLPRALDPFLVKDVQDALQPVQLTLVPGRSAPVPALVLAARF